MSGAGEASSSRTYRVLLVAVIVMGVLLVFGFVFVFATIAYRATRIGTSTRPLAIEGTPHSISLDGNRLAVLIATPEGDAVVIYDLGSGRETGRIKFLARSP